MLTRVRITAAALAASGLLLAPSGARAQRRPPPPPPASIPAGLLVALLGENRADGYEPAQLTVGRAPAGFPDSLLPPPPATVVGGTARGGDRSIIIAAAIPEMESVESYAAFLARAGWAPRVSTMSGFSFRSSTPDRARQLCRGGESMLIHPVGGAPAGTSYVAAQLMRAPERTGCLLSRTDSLMRDFSLDVPVLQPPPGAGGFGQGSSIRLETAMSPTEIVMHYGAQFAAAGWTVGPPVAERGVAACSLEVRDKAGNVRQGMLFALAMPYSTDVKLQIGGWKSPF